MKITNIYKKTAALFFLMAAALWPAVEAWGQAYVTGDRYDRYVTYIPVEKDYYNDNVTASIDGDRSPKDIFDGDNNTWWAANNVKSEVTFTFAFSESKEFDVIEILAGEQLYERPTSIIFKSGDFEQTFNNLESLGRNLSLSLSKKVTTQSFTLEFIPQNRDDAKIALNEVTLLRGENRVVDQTIYHKPAKWYDLRGSNTNESTGDTFQDDTGEGEGHKGMFHGTLFDEYIQAAHTYIDTIYVHKGTSIQLVLPTIQDLVGDNELTSTASYQRWYSYRTDKTFEVVNKDSKNNPEGVVDLLTPSRESSLGYRFANGYVGNPVQQASGSAGSPMYHSQSLVAMDFYYPTNTQFNNWIGNNPDHQINNDWYIVACDVSNYTDYTPDYTVDSKNSTFYPSNNTDGKVYEPTLSHRVLFYIVGVDERDENTNTTNWKQGHNRLTESEYHGGTKDGKYLEEYDINFPFRRYKANKEGDWATGEILSLSKDARSYAIPELSENEDNTSLDVSIVDGENTAEIRLVTSSLTGTERVIQFEYPNAEGDNTLTVKNPGAGVNPEATILVTKTVNGTTYNIAKYNLTFVKGYQLLTQHQVDQLDKADANKDAYWARYTYRTPKNLAENYTLNTELTWDYTDAVAKVYGQEDYYPFPMNWGYSSYAFYDGSRHENTAVGIDVLDVGDHFAQKNFPQWGYYAITKDYIEQKWTSSLPTPPNIGKDESTFHMYVDASDRPGIIARLPFRQNLCPNSELFVSAWVKNASASKTNHDPGMLFTIMGVKEVTETIDNATRTYETYTPIYRYSTGQIPYSANINGSIPGCGDGTNDWFQIYFSFINTQTGDEEFKSYLLQVENNSASTTGGDMYIDDIQVFMHTPSATVEQKKAVCGNDRALVRLQLGWEQLRSRLAADIQPEVETGAIDFCIIDTLAYREKISYGETSVTLEDIKAAIEFSTVYIGNNKGEGQEGHYNKKYATLSYNWEYLKNTEYNDDNVDGNLAANNNNSFYRRIDPDRGNECLAVDIYAALEGSRGYWLLMVDHNDSNALSDDNYAEVFGIPDDRCAMKDVFKVTAQNLIKINGTVVGDTDKKEYCAGQVFNFNIAMTYLDPNNDDKKTEYNGDVYFDWYFGTKSDFEAQRESYGNVSIEEALSAFRATYPDATELTAETEVNEPYFTANHRNLLVSLLKPIDDNHLNAPLVLHQEAREIRIMEGGLNLVVVPINTLEENDDFYTLLCWNPIFFTLNAKGKAPELSVGFNDVTYPDTWEGAIRVGLDQIQNAVEDKGKTINIPLRNAKLTDGSTSSKLVAINDRKDLYLVDSNDPVVEKIISQDDFDPFAYSIGTLVDLSAAGNKDDIMKVQFNLNEQTIGQVGSFTFNPREGYWYKFEVYFKEEGGASGACYGNLFVTMHVVPAFQKWVGESTGNWNNDANWVRSTKNELKKGDNDSYANYAEEHQGYVPMDFTKVTIPTNMQVELYASANNTGFADHSILDLSTTSPSGETTENIEYDLMVKSTLEGNAYNCIPYYTNTVNEIHFEPGAEMMHAELLDYKKAWVDYQLAGDRWYALSSPLKDVVSGDFYTDKNSGKEESEYFKDIKWSDNDNSRTNPSVYQRGWKGDAATMVVSTGGTEERAIAGNWSAVYNKADEGYDAGTGFSLKVLDLPAGTNNATFRLPKADTKYTYSGGTTTAQETNEITRTNANKLHVTDLNAGATTSISVPLNANSDNPYYLVGNPFMAHLDMEKFFEANQNLEPKYWVVKGDNQEVGVGGDNGLIDTDNGKIAPLSSFFVTKKANSTMNNEVVFTADMQTLNANLYAGDDDQVNDNALTITATTTDGRTSRAAVAYDMAASADYEVSEDAELFLDSNLGDVPMVYTVAGTMATSINRTSELYNIPLGVYGSKQEMVTLSFGGLNQFSSATLYDAQEQTETPLHEGKTVSVPAGTSGRYFLRAGTPTGNEVIARNAFLVYSVGGGKVMVTSSNTPLKDIRVYTMGGAQVRSIQASGMQQEIYLNRGIYLITVSDQDGLQETKKVLVR